MHRKACACARATDDTSRHALTTRALSSRTATLNA
eukprot:CAMPEP_0173059242 /NCGR_PEP_ID=MMETSP1102-20130122/1850_1 /TAXON_ID=49646 /ORGANISM="Geminigera sp., Strain Caron Lab Isolate" /LENGTH=34 /DNA_ID= /DNA_START= /DNA_END= /DNA_ORIENTATION=